MSNFGNYSSLLKYEEVKQQINDFTKACGCNYKSDTEINWTDTFCQISDPKNLALNLFFSSFKVN